MNYYYMELEIYTIVMLVKNLFCKKVLILYIIFVRNFFDKHSNSIGFIHKTIKFIY